MHFIIVGEILGQMARLQVGSNADTLPAKK
jgi:hypothetical protein